MTYPKVFFYLVLFCCCFYLHSQTTKSLGSTGSSGKWVKIARIQNKNPIDGGEASTFTGSLTMQTDFGQTGSQQYYAIFSFGCRGGIQPLLTEFGDASLRNSGDQSRVEWRIYKDPDGWHYLWFWQSNYSRIANFNYFPTGISQFWTEEAPPAGWTMLWSSLDGARQGTVLGGNTVIQNGQLQVNGTIRSKEVKVEAAPWPDYVFSDDYKLSSLEETEAYIRQHQHLPGIPSAEEVAENGIALGAMNAKLLEKVEELTLYQIELMKEVKLLKQENKNLQSELLQLKAE